MSTQIMIISSVHTWNDTRILFREAESLKSHYNVELHAVASFKLRNHNGVEVVGLPNFPRWARPASWIVLGWRAWRSNASVVHFHDPELLPLGVLLKFLGKKVIYDVHEDVCQDILQKVWLPKFMRAILCGIYRFWEYLGDSCLSAIVAVTEKIASGFHNPRTVVIKNYPPLEYFKTINRQDYERLPSSSIRLVYVGSLNRNRGSICMIKALSFLPQNCEYHLDIVGSFPEEKGLESDILSAAQPVAEHVTFHGRVEFPEAVEIMSRSNIGLICTQPTVNDLSGLPLKLFEYMAAGLGVIVSDFPLWHQYLESYPAHEFVDPTSPEIIGKGISRLAEKLNNGNGVIEHDRRRVIEKFDWAPEGKKLLRLYSDILSGRL